METGNKLQPCVPLARVRLYLTFYIFCRRVQYYPNKILWVSHVSSLMQKLRFSSCPRPKASYNGTLLDHIYLYLCWDSRKNQSIFLSPTFFSFSYMYVTFTFIIFTYDHSNGQSFLVGPFCMRCWLIFSKGATEREEDWEVWEMSRYNLVLQVIYSHKYLNQCPPRP